MVEFRIRNKIVERINGNKTVRKSRNVSSELRHWVNHPVLSAFLPNLHASKKSKSDKKKVEKATDLWPHKRLF